MSIRDAAHGIGRRHTLLPLVAFLVLLAFPIDTPSSGTTVVLDPGHGGREPGASVEGLVERDSNADLARRVRDLLRRSGIRAVLTRELTDRAAIDAAEPSEAAATYLDLQARVAAANAARADVFVSIHSNAIGDPAVRGVEAFYNADRPFADANRALAEALAARIAERIAQAGVEAPRSTVLRDTDVADEAGRRTPFFVLGPSRAVSREELEERGIAPASVGLRDGEEHVQTAATTMPGALLELLYVTNAEDAALLRDAAVREAIAQGIADAIREFLASTRGARSGASSPAAAR